MRLTSLQKFLTYFSILLLLFSGIAWLVFNFFINHDSSFRFLVPWFLSIHGAASYVFLVVFGMLLSTHIFFNWRVKKNRRPSGIILTALFFILILSGYGLYYTGNDEFRDFISYLHWIIGIFCSLICGIHFFKKNKTKNSLKLN